MDQADLNAAFAEIAALNAILKRKHGDLQRRERLLQDKELAITSTDEKCVRYEREERRLHDSIKTLRAEKNDYRTHTVQLELENQKLTKQVDRLKRDITIMKDRSHTTKPTSDSATEKIATKIIVKKPVLIKESEHDICCTMMNILSELYIGNLRHDPQRHDDWIISLASRLARIWRDNPKNEQVVLDSVKLGNALVDYHMRHDEATITTAIVTMLSSVSHLHKQKNIESQRVIATLHFRHLLISNTPMTSTTSDILSQLEQADVTSFACSVQFVNAFTQAIPMCNKPLVVNRMVLLAIQYLNHSRKYIQELPVEFITNLINHLVDISDLIDPAFLDLIQIIAAGQLQPQKLKAAKKTLAKLRPSRFDTSKILAILQ